MTFGDRLKEARTKANVSQAKAANAIGVNPGLISMWENGKCILRDPRKAKALAAFLNVSYEWLFLGQEKPKEKPIETATVEIPKTAVRFEVPDVPKPAEEVHVYRAEDGRKLDCINLCIRHIRDMHISDQEKKAIHKTLSGFRENLEALVLFGN